MFRSETTESGKCWTGAPHYASALGLDERYNKQMNENMDNEMPRAPATSLLAD